MARLKGPLMSLQASGKLADTLVFADWKGIPYARNKVDPSNPNTAAQQSIRGYMTAAVAQFHSTASVIGALQLTNLNRGANYSGKVMSGFNYYVKRWIETAKAGAALMKFYGTAVSDVSATGAEVFQGHGTSAATAKIVYGTSPTALVNEKARDEGATPDYASTFTFTGLTAATTYYYKVVSTIANSVEDAGIGKFVTLAS